MEILKGRFLYSYGLNWIGQSSKGIHSLSCKGLRWGKLRWHNWVHIYETTLFLKIGSHEWRQQCHQGLFFLCEERKNKNEEKLIRILFLFSIVLKSKALPFIAHKTNPRIEKFILMKMKTARKEWIPPRSHVHVLFHFANVSLKIIKCYLIN